jgi:hypothetical protein
LRKPDRYSFDIILESNDLQGLDVLGLKALGALFHGKFDFLVFLQGFEA